MIFKNLQHAGGICWRLRYTAIGPLAKDIWVLKLPQIPSLAYPAALPSFWADGNTMYLEQSFTIFQTCPLSFFVTWLTRIVFPNLLSTLNK